MDGMNDSDLTMVTNDAFNNVLQFVQNSCLNFKIQMSPFSAVISLKKSLIRSKSGCPIRPSLSKFNAKDLEVELGLMEKKYDDLARKYASSIEKIKLLEQGLNSNDSSLNEPIVSNESTQFLGDLCHDRMVISTDEKDFEIKKEIEPFQKLDSEIEALEDDLECSLPHDYKPLVAMPTVEAHDLNMVACSLCSQIMVNYCPQYFCGYKLYPACDGCMKRDLSKEQGPRPFSSFPSSEIPASLTAHWIQPFMLPPPPSSSSASFRSHYVKLPNPGQILYTAQDILQELKELMMNSKWWS